MLDLAFLPQRIVQVGSIERLLEVDNIPESQDVVDVVLHWHSGCGRQSHDGHFGIPHSDHAQLSIVLSEVLAPVRNAMHLVYHESGDSI